MRTLFLICACLSGMSSFSQSLEVSGGLIVNKFYDFNNNNPHYHSSYNSGLGYSVFVGIEGINIEGLKDWMRPRITLSYDRYSGALEASNGGLGGGSTTIADINKSIISLGLFPLNFKIKNRLDLNFGFELSGFICEKIEGTKNGWQMGYPPIDPAYDLNESYDRYSDEFYFGLKARVAYDFRISETLHISPQYSFYLGLSKEFDHFPTDTKSMRHYFCIGLEKKLKSKKKADKPE